MSYDRPIGLRPDPIATRAAGVNVITRAAIAHAVGAIEHVFPDKVAAKMWPHDRDAGLLVKGAVSQTTTTSAAGFLQTLVPDFIASLGPVSAGAILLQQALQLSFNGAAQISVPTMVVDADDASFVGEGLPIPVRMLLTGAVTLEPSKLAVIAALSREMVDGSNAQKLVEDVLSRSVGLALDKALFDANPAVPDLRPAGLRNGIAASAASAATGANDAMVKDVETLIAIVGQVSGTVPPVLVASPGRAALLKLRAPDMSLTVLPSSAIAPADLIAVAPNAIVSATDAAPEISASKETVLHMDDAPSDISTSGSAVAFPAKSMFQTDLVAIKVRMNATWALRDERGVAWLTATAW